MAKASKKKVTKKKTAKKKTTKKKATKKKAVKKVAKKATKKKVAKKPTKKKVAKKVVKEPIKKKAVKKKKLLKSKICCTICKECKAVNTNRLKKLVATFGSLEDLHAKYVCRTCRKTENVRADGKAKIVKHKRKKTSYSTDENGKCILPKWMTEPCNKKPRALTAEDYRNTDTCWRPDIWFENKRRFKGTASCNDCPYYETMCGCKTRKLVKVKERKVVKRKKAAKQ